ncbi:UvrD/REP helicase [Phlyctema vagabunda]|uniref:DNA 3'-5' helicase n=1 Tax=Phlyctema vagabunda TaxID=108571 RepID=A0ABR4PC44_9HELO
MSFDNLLQTLNSSQHAAVTSFADTLAILAGPGSGKTHTLTSRTAWLLHRGLQPWNIIVATFTVKAAREMKERIGKLIGNGLESKLILGTFHSISRRYLARYGHLIGIQKDFGIADSNDSLAIIKRIVKRNSLTLDPGAARSRISSRKSKGDHYTDSQKPGAKSIEIQEFETCYTEYEEALKRSNLLDYDDLLLRCVELLRAHPSCVSNVEAVLIDEFQDTNLVQFDLMRLFAAQRKRITIVGDPDQSIYSFRSAETKNFKRMQRQYPETVTIALEENYRSSGSILLSALSVIEQDDSRISKTLMPTHTIGTRPVLRKLDNAHKEAEWIVSEIRRCLGLAGTLLDLNDFAILLRSAALSRLIESALGKAGIAYKMVGGLRFYDRIEVKLILDYLRVISQPHNNDSLARIINVPSRRIGEGTIKALLEEADKSSISLWTLILEAAQGNRQIRTKLAKDTDRSITQFIDVILKARKKMEQTDPASQSFSTVDTMNHVISRIRLEEYLERKFQDEHESRWANVEELRTQASDFESMLSKNDDDEVLPEIDGLVQSSSSNSLSKFLANVALASEMKKDDEEGAATTQVTISTIHAAKGLEWPVVFIPAAYQGSIPHSRAEDSNEERRLLYVAMTRAKCLLYMSTPLKSSQGEETTLSPFLSQLSLAPLLDNKGPSLKSAAVQTIAQILRRPVPSLESISKSSASLKCLEDSLYSAEGNNSYADEHSRWNRWDGQHNFTMGQQAPKRQRLAPLGEADEKVELPWKGPHATTMDQATNFTTSGFVSAGSHLNVLKEQSVNQAMDDRETTQKASSKLATKRAAGQGSLLGFLGKPEPQPVDNPHHQKAKEFDSDVQLPSLGTARLEFNSAQTRVEVPGFNPSSHHISPLLATHRVGPSVKSIRPRSTMLHEPQRNNEYVFLSSSPPRPKRSKLEHESTPSPPKPKQPTGLTSKPTILPLIRPPKMALGRSNSETSRMALHDKLSGPVRESQSAGLKRTTSDGQRTTQPAAVKRPHISTLQPEELPAGSSARTMRKPSTASIEPPRAPQPVAVRPSESRGEVPPAPTMRPATTFHTTSMSVLQTSNAGKKTLGVRRSMSGWSSKSHGQGFKPPTMSRPPG